MSFKGKPSPYVFTSNGHHAYSTWEAKVRLNTKMKVLMAAEGLAFKPWQLRDLRRTARTLMSRAGVSTEIAEACLGHVRPSIEETYDQYDRAREKAEAFVRLGNLVEHIVTPPPARSDNLAANNIANDDSAYAIAAE